VAFSRWGVSVGIALVLLPASAAAQQQQEVAGVIRRTFISDKRVIGLTSFDTKLRSGSGLTFGASYGRRLWTSGSALLSLTFEVPVAVNPDEDIHLSVNLVPSSYSSFFVAPSARVNIFADQGVSPWLSFGGGFGHFSAASMLEFGGNNPGSASSTTGVLQLGAGFDVRVRGPLSFRFEVRDFDSGAAPVNVNTGNGRQHNLFVGGGAVWHF